MFTLAEIIIITKWLEKKFIGDFTVDFVQGFEDRYVLVSADGNEAKAAYGFRKIIAKEME